MDIFSQTDLRKLLSGKNVWILGDSSKSTDCIFSHKNLSAHTYLGTYLSRGFLLGKPVGILPRIELISSVLEPKMYL